MCPANFAEEVIGELACTVHRKVFITVSHFELTGWNFLQNCASTDAECAVTPNRVGQVTLKLESDRAAVARTDITLHEDSYTRSLSYRAVGRLLTISPKIRVLYSECLGVERVFGDTGFAL